MSDADMGVKGSRILIVDDDRPSTELLEAIFGAVGFTNLQSLNNSKAAGAELDAYKPDIVLLDLVMPDLDGFDLLDRIRNRSRDPVYLPVVILTADSSSETKVKALGAGANDFLTKPFDHHEVVLRVTNLLITRKLHGKLANLNDSLDLQNRLLDTHVKERTVDLEDARTETLIRLAKAAEYRDDDTGHHTQRVGRWAGLLGKQVGLDEEQCRLLTLAGPLHDVGKIGIPDSILLKPGKLTPEEFTTMKTHTSIGGRILGGSRHPVLSNAESLALTHHEKWDGSGYPAGLSGDAIPLGGRILAVVDVFDALSNDRPYRRAWPREVSSATFRKAPAITSIPPW